MAVPAEDMARRRRDRAHRGVARAIVAVALTLVVLVVAARPAAAAPATWTSSSVTTIGDGARAIHRVTVDPLGNRYLAGTFTGTVTFGPGTGGTYTASGSGSLFVASYTAGGAFRWARKMGAGSNIVDRIVGLARVNGNLVVYGQVFGGNRITGPFGSTTLTHHGGSDVFLVALATSDGHTVWARQDGGADNEQAGAITSDAVGQMYAVGSFRSSVTFTGTGASSTLVSDGLADGFLAKYAANGDFLVASNVVHGTQNDELTTVSIGSGYLVAGGTWRGNATIAGAAVSSYSMSSFLVRLQPTDPSTRVWLRLFKPKDPSAVGPDLTGAAVDGGGMISLGGTLAVTTQFFNYGSATPTLERTPVLSSDPFMARFHPNGTLQWVTTAGGAGSGGPVAVGAGNVAVMAGSFSGTIGLGGANRTSNGGRDVFVAAWDVNGTIVRAATWGGTGEDLGRAVAYQTPASTDAFVVGSLGPGPVTFPGGTSVSSNNRGFLTVLSPA